MFRIPCKQITCALAAVLMTTVTFAEVTTTYSIGSELTAYAS